MATKPKRRRLAPELITVPGFPGVYVTPTGGRVFVNSARTGKPTQRKTPMNKDGYKHVWLDEKHGTVAVHKLVCLAFHGARPSPAHSVGRRNGNRIDNRPGNLYWATRTEINQAAFDRRNPLTERQQRLAARPAQPTQETPARPRVLKSSRQRWESLLTATTKALATEGKRNPFGGEQPKSTDFDNE